MSENTHGSGHTFSCRIDGRAGYLHVFGDRLELIRSGRGAAQVIPLHLVTAVTTGKAGRLLTAVELVAAGGYVEVKLPSLDAPRVAELIASLAADAPALAPDPTIFAPAPVAPAPAEVFDQAEVFEAVEPMADEPVLFDPAPEDSGMSTFVMPDFSMKVEMPEWTPLAADDAEVVEAEPVDLAAIVSQREYVVAEVLSEVAIEDLIPAAAGSDLAAAAVAALAELETMLNEVPVSAVPEESDEPSIPTQAHDPVDLPPDLLRRLNRLEVLRNSGIMTDADFAAAEAELYETALSA